MGQELPFGFCVPGIRALQRGSGVFTPRDWITAPSTAGDLACPAFCQHVVHQIKRLLSLLGY